MRFFACEQDLSHEEPDAPLPDAVATGAEPSWSWGRWPAASVIRQLRRGDIEKGDRLAGAVSADVHVHGEAIEQSLKAVFELAGQGGFCHGWPRRFCGLAAGRGDRA